MLATLRPFLRKQSVLLGDRRRPFVKLLALGPAVAIVEIVTVLAMYPVVAILTGPAMGPASRFPFMASLAETPKWMIAPAFLALFTVRSVATLLYQMANARFMFDFERRLRVRMFDACLYDKPAKDLWGPGSGSTAATISYVLHNWGGTGLAILNGMYQVLMSSLLIATFLVLDPKSTVLAIVCLALVFLAYSRVFRGKVRAVTKMEMGSFDRMTTEVTDLISAVREVRILGRELRFHERMATIAKLRSSAISTLVSMQMIPRVFAECSLVGLVMALAAAAIYRTGSLNEFYPVLGMFGLAAMRLVPAFNQVVALTIQSRQHSSYVDRIYDFLSTGLAPADRVTRPQSDDGTLSFNDRLEFRDVRFAYGSDSETLRGASFSIRKGNLVALVGKSGSGKSTVADLISGFIAPTEGRILVDGVDVRDRTSSWRRNLAYMPQNICLIDGSIKANVALSGDEDRVDEERVRRALDEAQLGEFVATLPKGIETAVGENGVRLSGGQRQRMGLARALFFDRNLVLFDEPTAALDPEATAKFIELLRRLRGRQTIVVITHNRDLAASCDQMLVLADGVVKEAIPQRVAS